MSAYRWWMVSSIRRTAQYLPSCGSRGRVIALLSPSASRARRSCGSPTVPTRCGGPGGGITVPPCEPGGQPPCELLGAYPGALTPEVPHQSHLPVGEVVAVPGERAFEVFPRPLQKLRIRRGPARQLSQNVLAHHPSLDYDRNGSFQLQCISDYRSLPTRQGVPGVKDAGAAILVGPTMGRPRPSALPWSATNHPRASCAIDRGTV